MKLPSSQCILFAAALSLAALPGCGDASSTKGNHKTKENNNMAISFRELRMASLEYLSETGVHRGEELLREDFEDTSFDEEVIAQREPRDINGWFVNPEKKQMHKVYFITAPESYDVTVIFDTLEPNPTVSRIEVIVHMREGF